MRSYNRLVTIRWSAQCGHTKGKLVQSYTLIRDNHNPQYPAYNEDHYVNYRVAVGLLVGQGCEQSELPCLADGITKQGRRSWSFYMYRICCLIDRRIWRRMRLTNDIVLAICLPQTDNSNVKRPRPTALKDNMHRLDRVGRCHKKVKRWKRWRSEKMSAVFMSLFSLSSHYLFTFSLFHFCFLALPKDQPLRGSWPDHHFFT